MISVRLATHSDVGQLLRLRDVGIGELLTRKGGPRWQAVEGAWLTRLTHDNLAEMIAGRSDDPHLVLLGCIGDVPVAAAAVTSTGDRTVLSALYTSPRARGVGVGHAVISHVAVLAEDAGHSTLDSVALPGDRETKNFFEAHGMVSRLLTVSRRLG